MFLASSLDFQLKFKTEELKYEKNFRNSGPSFISFPRHTQECENSLRIFGGWLKNNPNANPNDLNAVKNIILDLRDALSLKGNL